MANEEAVNWNDSQYRWWLIQAMLIVKYDIAFRCTYQPEAIRKKCKMAHANKIFSGKNDDTKH